MRYNPFKSIQSGRNSILLPNKDQPEFYWRNLPNYLWVEGSLIVWLFRYIVYRVQRALKIT